MEKIKTTSFCLMLLSSSAAINSHATIVINEIDYDQPGTDTAEFIELYNSGLSPVSLDNFAIELINGSNSSSYRTINLTGFTGKIPDEEAKERFPMWYQKVKSEEKTEE